MAQVTIYMDNNLEQKIKQMAKDAGVSISKFISNTLEKNTSDSWHNDTKNLKGAWDDFPNLETIRDTNFSDIKREEF